MASAVDPAEICGRVQYVSRSGMSDKAMSRGAKAQIRIEFPVLLIMPAFKFRILAPVRNFVAVPAAPFEEIDGEIVSVGEEIVDFSTFISGKMYCSLSPRLKFPLPSNP